MGKIGVFHKKEGAFCTAFTTGRWRLYSALMLAQVCRGEGTGPREGIAGRPISVGISRRGKASGGREAGGWLYAIGSPQRARRETISANGCPRTCRGADEGKSFAAFLLAISIPHTRAGVPGVVENGSKKVFFRSISPCGRRC